MSRERPKTALLSLRLMGIRDMDILIMGRPKTLLLSRILMLGKPHLPWLLLHSLLWKTRMPTRRNQKNWSDKKGCVGASIG